MSRRKRASIGASSSHSGYWANAWGRLKKNKSAIVSLILLILIILVAMFAKYVSPYPYD